MRVVITGGAGFIGCNLSRHLLAADEIQSVVVIDDLSTGRLSNLDGVDVAFHQGSILDAELLSEVTDGADAVVHLAARGSVPRSLEDPLATHEVNATGTLRVLEAARERSAHVIVASSSSVYGATEELPKHEALPTRPLSPYATSKVATEWYTLAYQHSFGLPALAFRFFNVFGPYQPADHDYAAVIPRFVDAALAGRPLTVFGDGRQSRDFTYVDTLCEAITKAVIGRLTSLTPVNLAFGAPMDLLGLIAMIEKELGVRLEREHHEARRGDIKHSDANSAALQALIPELRPVELEEGLRRTIEWMRSVVPA